MYDLKTVTKQYMFQSTPSRRGRRRSLPCPGHRSIVSIHSLTQRETRGSMQAVLSQSVSIHSLTQRETLEAGIIELAQDVSIHSLTQRETTTYMNSMLNELSFQSTPSRRGRPYAEYRSGNTWTSFNPLPHAEGDGQ